MAFSGVTIDSSRAIIFLSSLEKPKHSSVSETFNGCSINSILPTVLKNLTVSSKDHPWFASILIFIEFLNLS